jgi:hypothetical protein
MSLSDNHTIQSYTIMTHYTIYLQYNDNGKTVNEIAAAETKAEALRLCEAELRLENTTAAYAVDSNGDLVE